MYVNGSIFKKTKSHSMFVVDEFSMQKISLVYEKWLVCHLNIENIWCLSEVVLFIRCLLKRKRKVLFLSYDLLDKWTIRGDLYIWLKTHLITMVVDKVTMCGECLVCYFKCSLIKIIWLTFFMKQGIILNMHEQLHPLITLWVPYLL